jgi:hypothetical protein
VESEATVTLSREERVALAHIERRLRASSPRLDAFLQFLPAPPPRARPPWYFWFLLTVGAVFLVGLMLLAVTTPRA